MEHEQIPKHPHDHHIAYTLLLLGLICVIFAFILLSQFLTTIKTHPLPISRQTNEIIIEDWMTIAYLSKAYHIPEHVFFTSLDVTPRDMRKSLKSIAKTKGISSQQIVLQTKDIIKTSRINHPSKNP